MKGLHKSLNTKADYDYIKANEPESSWRYEYQMLLDGLYCWQMIGDNESTDDYDQADVRTVPGEDGNTVTQVYKQDAYCKLFRLGFTVSEIEAALN